MLCVSQKSIVDFMILDWTLSWDSWIQSIPYFLITNFYVIHCFELKYYLLFTLFQPKYSVHFLYLPCVLHLNLSDLVPLQKFVANSTDYPRPKLMPWNYRRSLSLLLQNLSRDTEESDRKPGSEYPLEQRGFEPRPSRRYYEHPKFATSVKKTLTGLIRLWKIS